MKIDLISIEARTTICNNQSWRWQWQCKPTTRVIWYDNSNKSNQLHILIYFPMLGNGWTNCIYMLLLSAKTTTMTWDTQKNLSCPGRLLTTIVKCFYSHLAPPIIALHFNQERALYRLLFVWIGMQTNRDVRRVLYVWLFRSTTHNTGDFTLFIMHLPIIIFKLNCTRS